MCVDLSQVLKILPLAAWAAVPEGPPYLTGVMNLHGRCVPVIDLSVRLGLGAVGFTLDTPMLWCQSGDVQGVLLVSDIHGVETVVDDDVQMRPLFDEGMAPYLAAMRFSAGPALLLDLQRVLDIAMIADIENMFADPRKLLEEFSDI